MRVGIVGLPNVGKSTLFCLLSGKTVKTGNYPFCTIDPNSAVLEVPDERVDRLAEISGSKKKIYSIIEFLDIAGLVQGASEGEGLGNKFLGHITGVDMILHLVRCFHNNDIIHVSSENSVLNDIETINKELRLWDISILESSKKKYRAYDINAAIAHLTSGKPLETFSQDEKWKELFKSLALTTDKPMLYVGNVFDSIKDKDKMQDFSNFCQNKEYAFINAEAGLVVRELPELLAEYENKYTDPSELIKKCYNKLNLISFLTTGPEETRSWSITKGTTAIEAAGKIHTDFIKKFVCAEIIPYNKFLDGDRNYSTRSKDYIVNDGDICLFKIR